MGDIILGKDQAGSKVKILIATNDNNRHETFKKFIENHLEKKMLFKADDGPDAEFKLENSPPKVFITDYDLPTRSGVEVIKSILDVPKYKETSFIIVSNIPDEEIFVDDVVRGRVQFLTDPSNEKTFISCLEKALYYGSASKKGSYNIVNIKAGDHLIKEGDASKDIFLLKVGKLQAYKGQGDDKVVLGIVSPGEFVGEMAHFIKSERSASVEALEDCELIKISEVNLDQVLFSKPAWAKALFTTLSKRLKQSNDAATKNGDD